MKMSTVRKLRVAFLTGSDNNSTRLSVESVCAVANVEPVALLLDTEHSGSMRRLKNLRKNIRKEGWKYIPIRIVEAMRSFTDRLVENAVVSKEEVCGVLRKAFPGRCFTLSEIAEKYGFRIAEVGNINGPVAIRTLKDMNVDLGIVIGTRVLKEGIFTVPKMGCINLHK